MINAIVIDVKRPSVAHTDDQWEVTVVYGQKMGTFLKRIRKTVFTNYRPEIGHKISVRIL